MRFPIWRFSKHVPRSFIFYSNRSIFRSLCAQPRLKRMEYRVVHDEDNHEFYITIGKERAVLQYQILGDGNKIMDMYHTEVPQNQRGKGLAGHLAKVALSYVVETDLRVRPTCSYIEHYINKNQPPGIMQRLEQ